MLRDDGDLPPHPARGSHLEEVAIHLGPEVQVCPGRGQVMLWAQGHQREPLGSNSGWYSDNKLQRGFQC